MSRKSKKLKKPKAKEVKAFSASNIDHYIRIKFDIDDNGFWTWFLSDCSLGETTVLSLIDDDGVPSKYKEYYNIIKTEFLPDSPDKEFIEIENDL